MFTTLTQSGYLTQRKQQIDFRNQSWDINDLLL